MDQHVLPRVSARQPSLSAAISPNSLAHTPDPAAIFVNCGVKTPDSQPQRNPSGTPSP
jgi:hypothetical protein